MGPARPREHVDISPHLGGKRRDSPVGWVEGNRTRVYNLLNCVGVGLFQISMAAFNPGILFPQKELRSGKWASRGCGSEWELSRMTERSQAQIW